jgi:hypothetical protein
VCFIDVPVRPNLRCTAVVFLAERQKTTLNARKRIDRLLDERYSGAVAQQVRPNGLVTDPSILPHIDIIDRATAPGIEPPIEPARGSAGKPVVVAWPSGLAWPKPVGPSGLLGGPALAHDARSAQWRHSPLFFLFFSLLPLVYLDELLN